MLEFNRIFDLDQWRRELSIILLLVLLLERQILKGKLSSYIGVAKIKQECEKKYKIINESFFLSSTSYYMSLMEPSRQHFVLCTHPELKLSRRYCTIHQKLASNIASWKLFIDLMCVKTKIRSQLLNSVSFGTVSSPTLSNKHQNWRVELPEST